MLEDKLTQQKQFTTEYFKLRIELETELSDFKSVQSKVKKSIKERIIKNSRCFKTKSRFWNYII